MTPAPVAFRPGGEGDEVAVSALAMQVFLDTYATDGVRPDLAREAFHGYSVDAFAQRLADGHRRFVLAERGTGLVAFAELQCSLHDTPVAGMGGAELVRLYVQPRAQRSGIGRRLLEQSEQLARAAHQPTLWLTVWDGNAQAIDFYRAMGYSDVGTTTYAFEGNSYGNRVFSKAL